ncbi:MAG: hypothetical protein MK213_06355, partial [Planctomycetes bacterium]|nr:hypothetical protein [Planctomycetota bacterium]
QETLTWAVRQAAERGVRPLPLLDAGNLAGVLDEAAAADLLAQGKDLQELKAGDCIQEAPPLFAYETPWTELIPAMQRHHAVLVQNALGITSMDRRDWLRALARIDHNLD